jgi:predicted RNA-binding protein with PUA-like domain
MKSEPSVFGFEDLMAAKGRTSAWDGVRNYQARNFMRAMRRGDLVFIYHSNAKPAGIVGVAEVVREAYPDPTQFEVGHEHYDARSKPDAPSWDLVDVRAIERLPRVISLEELKQQPGLSALQVCQRGSRLSVSAVSAAQWRLIRALSERKLSP